jgi:hypothetical protein
MMRSAPLAGGAYRFRPAFGLRLRPAALARQDRSGLTNRPHVSLDF